MPKKFLIEITVEKTVIYEQSIYVTEAERDKLLGLKSFDERLFNKMILLFFDEDECEADVGIELTNCVFDDEPITD